jgi:DNA-binding transcriptional LysR family regulator
LGCDADHRRHGYLFLLIGDPLWLIAANLTYLIGISMPSIDVWLLRRAIEGLRSVRDLEALPLIWRESGSGTRAVVESVLKVKDSGDNPRKLDQRFELGSNEAIKSLVIGGLGVGFFSCWDIQQEIAIPWPD